MSYRNFYATKKINCTTAFLVLSFSLLPTVARAATVTTSGIWSDATPVPTLEGLNTNQIRWGTPVSGAGKSGYIFEGINSVPVSEDGSLFLISNFTHQNFTISGGSIDFANLQLTLNFQNGETLNTNFNFVFNHNETDNNGPCSATPGFDPPCPDVVSVPEPRSLEEIEIGGETYNLIFEGFRRDGELVEEFITFEDEDNLNSAQLFASLQLSEPEPEPEPEPIPEPLTILGTGFVLASLPVLKKAQKKNNN
ncbi:THxN family PEP-CTERM protein [Gloeocapsa sp. PCC 73106]|uniref:THxN family PEP-CTERM protein n=1 Tax=Gloeocapsa sp. PCC 73106 TaxID=102232 RepID=UPI0002AC95B8|nr:THxN family PEP-CTERM protein [Gloeocapsa sp. PCC 73106]ELR97736.1 hypothetical protein GLO73106DRAFT_00015500 [Gloeocapsa sp. PCC 73106]